MCVFHVLQGGQQLLVCPKLVRKVKDEEFQLIYILYSDIYFLFSLFGDWNCFYWSILFYSWVHWPVAMFIRILLPHKQLRVIKMHLNVTFQHNNQSCYRSQIKFKKWCAMWKQQMCSGSSLYERRLLFSRYHFLFIYWNSNF